MICWVFSTILSGLNSKAMQSSQSEPNTSDLGREDFDVEDLETTEVQAESEASSNPEKADESVRQELSELKDKYLRLMAEFDNFRKRTARQRNEERATAAIGTVNMLLPVADDFDRAKAIASNDSTDESFSSGVELVYQKFKRTLDALGLKAMVSTGEPFDAELHEAFTEIPAPSPEMVGKVMDTIEPGYFLNDKLIRHAKVVVGK